MSPGITGHPEDKYVIYGEDITLSCQLNNSATITWYHNDASLGIGAETSRLVPSTVEGQGPGTTPVLPVAVFKVNLCDKNN